MSADPWLDPGDSGLRHDLQFLADRGLIGTPLTVWPLSWGDIAAEIADADAPDDGSAAALARIRAQLREARVAHRWQLGAEISAGTEPRLIRDFEDLPREQGEVAATLTWSGDRTAMRLVAQYVTDPDDERELRADGSYLGLALGNWMLAAAQTDRWWGPGWQSSMILSSNARPIPAFTIDRNSTAPFESKWLSWIGHWDFSAFWGFLENDRDFPDARLTGMRLTVKPARWLEFGLSRTAMWCGRGRPCDFDTFTDVLFGRDNADDDVAAADEPGNQLGGYDLRLSAAGWNIPLALYTQRIGEDAKTDYVPSLMLTQAGLETWAEWRGVGNVRLYLEVSDTLCGGNLTGDGSPNCAYNHHLYTTGMRYRGRSIGHSFDNDAEIWTLGALLNDRHDGSWVASVAAGDLNREGGPDSANTLTPIKQAYRSASLVHRRALPVGELQAQLGYESFEPDTGDSDEEWRGSLRWQGRF